MDAPEKRLIPGWAWGVVVALAVALAAALALTDKRPEPGQSLRFDVSAYEKTAPGKIRFREAARWPVGVPSPRALAVCRDGRVLVAGENAVQVLDGKGAETARFAVEGAPECLTEAPDGTIFLGMRDHVVVLDGAGVKKAAWESPGEKAWIASIAADGENVYAADAGNRVVLRYDHAGKQLGRIGEKDEARGIPGLIVPSPHMDVQFDPSGALWVANPGRHGLECYRPTGELVDSWYRAGMGVAEFCGCCNPANAAFRPDGALVTAEKGITRVKLYGPDTEMLAVVAAPAALGAPEDQSDAQGDEPLVADLATDASGRILVLHRGWNAVLAYEEERP